MVDHICRFESLEEDMNQLSEMLDLSPTGFDPDILCSTVNYPEFFNSLTRDLVDNHFLDKDNRFGYQFSPTTTACGDSPNRFQAPQHLIVHFSHHKAGTLWFQRVLKKLSQQLGWNFQSCFQQELDNDTHIFMQENSRVELDSLPQYRGSHLIRDPRDMVVSGYFYHLWCNEAWCLEKREKFEDRSYQDVLNSISTGKGIEMEIENCRSTFSRMAGWDYQNSHMIEVRFEDLLEDQYETFKTVFEKYGLSPSQIETGLSVVKQCDFERTTGRKKGQAAENSHLRKGISGDWKNHFNAGHKQRFKELYPGLLVKLEYEIDDNW